jgi:ribulose-phosphate 3-epimerase
MMKKIMMKNDISENRKISASILSADFSKLSEEIKLLEKASVDYLHLDVMDGSFVPNISFGAKLIKDIRPHTKILFDTHLMISNPEKYIIDFCEAGSDIITIHYESTIHVHRAIDLIKKQNKLAGLAIVPSTPISAIEDLLEEVDLVLIMTVNPGFGGQKFIDSQLKKISTLRNKIDQLGKKIILSVDGGVNSSNAALLFSLGADLLVAGSFIFGGENYHNQVKLLKS